MKKRMRCKKAAHPFILGDLVSNCRLQNPASVLILIISVDIDGVVGIGLGSLGLVVGGILINEQVLVGDLDVELLEFVVPRLAAARLKKRESRSPTRGCGFLSFFR